MTRFWYSPRPSSSLASGRQLSSLVISLLLAASLAAISGCLSTDDDSLATGSSDSALWSMNGLSANGLSANGLSANGLSANGLSANGLSANGLSANGLSANGLTVWELDEAASNSLEHSQSGRELLAYIARCALPEGEYLRVESGDMQWDVPGHLGLTPEWATEALSLEGEQLISACLLAHVNAFDLEVDVSLRTEALPAATGEETERYFYGDGTFYGNLFEQDAAMYACKIPARDFIDPTTGALTQAASPDAEDRICADGETANKCNITYTGFCDQVCNVIEQDGAQWRFSDCLGADGKRYGNTISVWLTGKYAESCDSAPDGYTCDPLATSAI